MKSSALQWQIMQQELELKMTVAVAEFWKTHEQTLPPTHISGVWMVLTLQQFW